MNTQRIDDDSKLPELLAEFDEAVKGSSSGSLKNPTHSLKPDEDAEFRRAMMCVRMLEDVFPRRATGTAGGGSHPASLGRFRILRKLGQGGFGVVYLAEDPQLGREVALKVPHAHTLTDAETLARFRREAQAAAALDHPNLVPVYEAGEAVGVNYIALAYCPGMSLAQWLAARPQTQTVSPREAGSLIATLARAVHYAHERGIVHRDLKPANILLLDGDSGSAPLSKLNPKITDFGLAKDLDGGMTQTQTGIMAGTPNYMAPEQAGGRAGGGVGPATDVYALGAILYELLTGRAPFRGDSALETLHQVRFAEPVPPSRLRPRLNRDLETICLKCLEKEAEQRYATAAALAADLEAYLEDMPIQARPITRAHRALRWCRRKPVVAALTGALVLAVMGGGGLLIWHRHRVARHDQEMAKASAEATQAWRAAEANFAKAAKAGAKADARYEQNWSAVERLMDVSEDLLRRPRVDAAGKAVLEELLVSYQRFAREKSEDRAVRLRSARALLRVANLSGALGQYDKTDDALRQAGEMLQGLVQEAPEDLEARRALVGVHVQKAFYERRKGGRASVLRAVESYERALADVDELLARDNGRYPDQMTKWNILDSLGRSYINLNDAGRAEPVLRQSMELQQRFYDQSPGNPVHQGSLAAAFEALSQVEQSHRRWQQADDWCRKALALQEKMVKDRPAVPSYQFHLAWMHGRLAEISRARGTTADTETHVTEAIRLLEKLHAASPSDHQTGGHLARFLELAAANYRQTGKLADASAALHRALAVRGGLATDSSREPMYLRELVYPCYLLGCVFIEQREFAKAVGAFGRVLVLHEKLPDLFPEDFEFRSEVASRSREIGNLLRQMRANAEAQTAYRQALAHFVRLAAAKPDDREPLRQEAATRQLLGQLQFDVKNFDAARDSFEHAITIGQRLTSSDKATAQDRAELSGYRRGLSHTFIQQGRALWAKGEETGAESSFRAACRAAADDPEAQNDLAWFLVTCADPNLRGHAEALDLAQRAAKAAPKAAHVHHTLGAAHYRNADYAAAIAAIDQAIRLRGHGTGEDWFFQAMARWRLNEKEAARRDYDNARDWMQKDGPNDPSVQRLRAEAEALMEISKGEPA